MCVGWRARNTGDANVLCVVIEQHEGGTNPTESMTRALISEDAIARQSGPVQLGYVYTKRGNIYSESHWSKYIIPNSRIESKKFVE